MHKKHSRKRSFCAFCNFVNFVVNPFSLNEELIACVVVVVSLDVTWP